MVQQQLSGGAMVNQMAMGMNQNPVHVLSAGAGDLLHSGVKAGNLSPTY